MARAEANPAGIDAVLLDAFGTLLELEPPGPRLRRELRSRAGIDVGGEAARAAFRAEIEHYLAHHLAGRDRDSLEALRTDCAEVVRRSLGLGVDLAVAVRSAMLAAIRFRAHADAAPSLTALRARGVRLAVVSNWDCSLRSVLDEAGLGSSLDAVVTSAEVGAAKPDPRPFRAALEVLNVDAERAVHVGDSLEQDVAGARAAGVRAVLVAREGGSETDRRESIEADRFGVPVVGSLATLPALLFGE